MAAQAPHLGLDAPHLALAPHFAPHLAPHLAAHFAPHFAAHLAPHLAALALGPHLAGAQLAAKALPLSAAAVTTAEARALESWEDS